VGQPQHQGRQAGEHGVGERWPIDAAIRALGRPIEYIDLSVSTIFISSSLAALISAVFRWPAVPNVAGRRLPWSAATWTELIDDVSHC
jgi:hypothetical protein